MKNKGMNKQQQSDSGKQDTTYNGIFSRRQIFVVLSQKHGDYFSRILIFAAGNVSEK